ncbi:HipA domain-containing protein [Hansschlegelia sp. KR7-227]|uniref:HipA domain-containing protein n=1 Tax=Hansschlegelia sp. KR7-227 TaxID=3400914 RepID=UPI003C0DE9CA
MTYYPVFDVSAWQAYRPEALGTKEKRWLTSPAEHSLPGRMHLFKIGRAGTGENWSEKVVSEIAKGMGLPCAQYDFATSDNEKGVITPRFLADGGTFFAGNFLLSTITDGYDGEKRFQQIKYTIDRVVSVLKSLPLLHRYDGFDNPTNITPIEVFLGYLILDILVGNTDRHHENWGVIANVGERDVSLRLAPTFDHASSLGRNEPDDRRRMRLSTNDRRATVCSYAHRGKSAFYAGKSEKHTLLLRDTLGVIKYLNPKACRYWAETAVGLTETFFEEIFLQIDPSLIESSAIDFALAMLKCNQRTIREVGLDA